MTWLQTLMTAAETLGLVLLILLMAAWVLEDIAAKVTRVVDCFLIPAVQRLGDLGAAWHRLLTAVHTAWTRWRG